MRFLVEGFGIGNGFRANDATNAAELAGAARDIQLCEVLQAVAAWQLVVEEVSASKNLVAVLHSVFDLAAAEPIQVGQVACGADDDFFENDALNCLVFAPVTAH